MKSWGLALLALATVIAPSAGAQPHAGHLPNEARPWSIGARAVGLITRADPGPAGIAHTEGYITQPTLAATADLLGGRVFSRLTLNLEGITLERGELNLGGYGEGFVDRRHPHTYLHEAVAGVRGTVGGFVGSLTGGKGFVPFGSDDPMMRPFVKYPVNHHLAQVLERLILAGAVRRGPVLVEGALFNGDEPVSPGTAPKASHFGDSWAARVTLLPVQGLELSGSYASVESPEFRPGFGLDQRKWHVAARYEPSQQRGRFRYALAEWGRTADLFGKFEPFHFTTALAEATVDAGAVDVSLRLERTTRPEEDRLLDPFRSPRPLSDFNIIGVTRWSAATVALSRTLGSRGGFRASAFVEGAYLRPRETLSPTVFVPREFYQATTLWMLSGGVRLSLGHEHANMGRYGAASR